LPLALGIGAVVLSVPRRAGRRTATARSRR